jgi:hypothetical protein
MRRLLLIVCTFIIALCALASAQDALAEAEDGQAGASTAPDYGDTYTPEELAALDQALWAGNLTRADMHFMKDYGEGYGCFPIVHEMMDDPLKIAPWMDAVAAYRNWSIEPGYLLSQVGAFTSGTPRLTSPQAKTAADLGAQDDQDLAGMSLDTIVDSCVRTISQPVALPWDKAELETLRSEITTPIAWHSFESSIKDTNDESSSSTDLNELYTQLSKLELVEPVNLTVWQVLTWRWQQSAPRNEWPESAPYILDTEYGRICIGTPGDDYYEGDFAVLIEPGGNDTYHNCRIGAAYGKRTPGTRLGPDGEPTGASADYSPLGDGHIGYFCDLGGDDLYDCADVDITLGAAVLGVAAFYDLGGGNDRYYGGFCSLGAAMGGVATFYDDGGCDYYSGKAFTQGAAGFGIGIMTDDSLTDAPVFDTAEGNEGVIDEHESGASDKDVHSQMDNDYYTAWEGAQAFARTRGVALCINRRGNEVYHAGGVYLHAPLFADRYHSFSQGFAIGERDIDWAGGIAMLIDYAGNDRYLGDIYSQGVGYWYSAGLLWDGGGNDSYEMTQYGQGAGIHLAVGGLVDCAGNDTYVMHSGLGQGGSHDLSASILHDRGGDDRYMGATTCNGAALTGSVGIQIDRSGNDTYGGRKDSGVNHTDNRSYNIGVLVDCAGNDDYLGIQADGLTTLMRNLSMTADIAPPPVPESAGEAMPAAAAEDTAGANVPLPEVISYKGELTQEVFDELWAICCRWEVGDNRYIVPKAKERLLAFGPQILTYLEPKMNDDESLTMRGYTSILQPLYEGEGKQAVIDLLKRQAATDDETRQNNALYIAGDIKVAEMADTAAGFLDSASSLLQRRAMGVLASLGSHAGDDKLIALLTSDNEVPLKSALSAAITLKIDCYPAIQPLLSHPLISVRELAIDRLAGQWETYGPAIEADIAELAARETLNAADLRRARSLQHVLMRLTTVPSAGTVAAVGNLLPADDWGLRGDAVRTVRHWEKLAQADLEWTSADPQLVDALDTAGAWVDELLQDEQNPYVKACGETPAQ